MAIEAPYSKYKKTNLKIGIVFCLALAIWCIYDGYYNDDWIKEHTDADGNPEAYLVFNRQGPYYLFGGAVLLGAYMSLVVKRKVLADENELVIDGKEKIAYDAIKKIDKTYFDKKGYFIIIYEGRNGRQVNRKFSDKNYDNLSVILDLLVAEIS